MQEKARRLQASTPEKWPSTYIVRSTNNGITFCCFNFVAEIRERLRSRQFGQRLRARAIPNMADAQNTRENNANS